MKNLFICLFTVVILTNVHAQTYTPAPANLQARSEFQDAKFGLFIHWGVFSILGDGEWVMNNENIHVKDYTRLEHFFYPVNFDAHAWVSMAKNAGMKYITLITRHHDGFSLWDTKYSDFNMMNTPYAKDVVKMISDECHKQGLKLFLYYSLLDWRRDDYSWWTGRTGQGTGRTIHGDWNHYIQFMKDQLTELLTNYGKIDGIWFDGYWDQTAPEGAKDRSPRVDWHLEEIYSLIHKLQPQCLVGNNHHMTPFAGEDFQMFEKDLPGKNQSGLNFQTASQLPLETCETMNNSWGFNIKDDKYKSVKDLVHYIVNAAGRNANFLLNVGPMPNGIVQQEFRDTLKAIGDWMGKYGQSIYGTRGTVMPPQDWGVITSKGNKVFIHILKKPATGAITLSGIAGKVIACKLFDQESKVKFSQKKDEVSLEIGGLPESEFDTIVELTIK